MAALAHREQLGPVAVGHIYAQFTGRKSKERFSLHCPQVLGIDELMLVRAG